MKTNKSLTGMFITHSHTDHTLEIPCVINARRRRDKVFNLPIYAPSRAIPKIVSLLSSVIMLSGSEEAEEVMRLKKKEIMGDESVSDHEFIERRFECDFMSSACGDEFLVFGSENIHVEVMQAYHIGNFCNGYGFSTVRHKLKEEFNYLKHVKGGGKKLEMLKKCGTEITTSILVPELLYFCDSSYHNFEKTDAWRKYPSIICECTGYPIHPDYPESHDPEQMIKIEHTHLDQLLPFIQQYPEKQWILIHASMAICDHHLQDVEMMLRKQGLNVTIWRDEVYK
jgi:ribonuclease BN (tRNA processing enzyme)